MTKNILKNFYEAMESQSHPILATFVFVYNDYNTYADANDPHIEECFDFEEVNEILDSVRDLFIKVLSFGSEALFLQWCIDYDHSQEVIYVYSMAQNIRGYSRRTLIPAICEYYGFINVGASAYLSALGCNKMSMFNLLEQAGYKNALAPTKFISTSDQLLSDQFPTGAEGLVVLKPPCESCCIDVYVVASNDTNLLLQKCDYLIQKYGRAMVQEYVAGKEIGITVVWHKKRAIALTPIQLVFEGDKKYLTSKDSFYCNYQLTPCLVPDELIEVCQKMSEQLEFHCVVRYDFRFDGFRYCLFDISPNPTINGYTSSNFAAQHYLNCDHRGILRLLTYEKICLFEPAFDGTENV